MLIPWNRVSHLLDDVHASFFSPSPSLFLTSNIEGFSPHYPRWRDEGDVASLTLEVPGYAEDDIEVTIDGDQLIVTGTVDDHPPEGYTLRRKERQGGRFKHAFKLAPQWDSQTLRAQLADGLLSLSVSKAVRAPVRRISVHTQPKEVSDA